MELEFSAGCVSITRREEFPCASVVISRPGEGRRRAAASVGKVPVSDLADELGVQPSLVHLWVKQVLDQAEKAFEPSGRSAPRAEEAKDRADRAARSQAGQEERGHLRADGGERPRKKSQWGTLNGRWVPHDTRDEVVDYVKRWTDADRVAGQATAGLAGHLARSKFHDWKDRYGKANEHNGQVPRDWLAGRLGEAGHPRLSRRASAGRLSAV